MTDSFSLMQPFSEVSCPTNVYQVPKHAALWDHIAPNSSVIKINWSLSIPLISMASELLDEVN